MSIFKTHALCFDISIVCTMMLGDLSGKIVDQVVWQTILLFPTKYVEVSFYLYILLLLVPIIAVHEALHGLAYTMFGGKIKYGFKGIYAYTMEISEKPIQRLKFLVVLLMPVVIISVGSIFLPSWLGE